MADIYVGGSLRNHDVRVVAEDLRSEGYTVFDDWHAGGPEADERWREYYKHRGQTLREALEGPFVQNIIRLDKTHIDGAKAFVLVLPTGPSGHMELMYAAMTGKVPVLFMPEDSLRWDAMYALVPGLVIVHDSDELVEALAIAFEEARLDPLVAREPIPPGTDTLKTNAVRKVK